MLDRKRVFEILIIAIGGAYLLYRIFAPKMDMEQTAPGSGDATGDVSAGPAVAGLKGAAKNPAQADRELKNEVVNARDIFQKPNEFFAVDAKAGSGAASKTQDISLSLEGIIWGQGKNVAILSGIVVTEGDIIQGAKVIRIEPGRVVIFKNGAESEIKRGK